MARVAAFAFSPLRLSRALDIACAVLILSALS